MHSRTHSPAVFRNMPLLSPSRPSLFPSLLSAYCLSTARITQCSVIIYHGYNRWCVHLENIFLSDFRTNDAILQSPRTRIGRSEYRAIDMCVDRSLSRTPMGPISIRGPCLFPFSHPSIGKRGRSRLCTNAMNSRFFFVRWDRSYHRLSLARILSRTYESSDDKIFSCEAFRYSRYSHCSPSLYISLCGHSREIITRSFVSSSSNSYISSRGRLSRFRFFTFASRCVSPLSWFRTFCFVRSITRFGCSLHDLPAAPACHRPASSRSRS